MPSQEITLEGSVDPLSSPDSARRTPARRTAFGLALAGVFCAISVSGASGALDAAFAGGDAFVREAQVLESDRTGVAAPVGLAFSPAGSAFHVTEARPGGTPAAETEVVTLTPFAHAAESDRAGHARIQAALRDPINVTFDPRRSRLLLLDQADRLLEVRADAQGMLDPGTLVRHDGLRLDLQDAQGMSVDPANGTVFILDGAQLRIVRVEPAADGSFDTAVISEIDLRPSGPSGVRGLAFDPSSGHLHLGSGRKLYELTTAGEAVAARDLSDIALANPQGMVFAPSGDQTDDPAELSVYVADSGGTAAGSPQAAASSGQIVELSLAAAPVAATIDFTAQLVHTIDTAAAAFQPPSPDPSGITYLPATNTLLMSDGEVEETVNNITHFKGVNVWEMTLLGAVVDTANVSTVAPTQVPMSNEPTGVTFRPVNGHYFFSQDDGTKVHDLNPGGDGEIGTADDSWTTFSANGDAEGIAYDTRNDRLFQADGVGAEIWQYTPTGSLIGHFDVERFGVLDPETVEYNAQSDTLFVLSNLASGPIIVETTKGGALLQTIDVSNGPNDKPAGLAYAPASNGSGAMHFYLADRGVDNNSDPRAVDGKIFEFTAPTSVTPGNNAPTVNAGADQSIAMPATASLNGTVSDDNVPNPPGTVTASWSQVSGPGTVTFGNASAAATTANLPVPGTYVLRLTASDSELTTSDEITITDPNVGSLDVRVGAGSDDAEEPIPSGSVNLTSSDLELTTDGTQNQTVGMRFVGINVPQGAAVSSAYVQFQSDGATTAATSLTIQGQAADNPATFATTSGDLSGRARTTAAVSWSPPAWNTSGQAGADQQTPNVASVIQEIVDRPGWLSGNSMVVIVTGTGLRRAMSWNGSASGAALLHVEWSTGAPNQPPSIISNGGGATASVSAAENQTAVTTVTASDPDIGDTLTYSRAGGADQAAFQINASTGVLTFVNAPDYETRTDADANGVYEVTVQASDGSLSDTQAISVTVTNVNEAPVVNAGSDQTIALPASASLDGTVTDDGPSLTTTWSKVSGPGDVTFGNASAVDTTAGFSAEGSYVLRLQATDSLLTTSDTVAITVNPPTLPPTITSDGGGDTAAVSVAENQTAVTDVDATDPDAGDTVTYSIVPGGDAAAFAIVGATGVLTFGSAPNFEAPTDAGGNNVYDVTVQASDGKGGSDTQAIAVTVTNVAENPVIGSNGGGASATVSKPENQMAVTTVTATDPDVGDTVSYSIVPGGDATAFTIVSTTGALTFVTAPDYELPTDSGGNNVYEVTVQASDGALADSQALAVTVTDVNENPAPLYFSLRDAATVGGVSVTNEDIVAFDGIGGFSILFDGSQVGLGSRRLDAFTRVDADTFLLSFDTDGAVLDGIVETVDDSDVIQFDATSLGENTTVGAFSMYFDGSDVGLTSSSHDVDAVELLPGGTILISTTGSLSVSGISARDEDLLAFTGTFGADTTGSFAMYFDGGDVGLGGSDVDAAAVDSTGNIYLSTSDVFAVTGVSGDDEDVFVFDPTSTGPTTAGSYLPTLYFDGSAFGLAANDVYAIDLP